jgi:hypothetical protein
MVHAMLNPRFDDEGSEMVINRRLIGDGEMVRLEIGDGEMVMIMMKIAFQI